MDVAWGPRAKVLARDWWDRSDKVLLLAYNTLFSGTGKIYSNAGLDIDRDKYPGGFALYAFDLTPDMCKSSEYFNTVQRGSLSLALTFREAAKHPLAMVCYGDFENVIRIDAERNAIYDIA